MKAILLNRILLVLAFAGLFVSGVLSLGHLLNISVPCGLDNGCETVAQSEASKVFGVPVAYFGFLTYLGLAVIASMRALLGFERTGKTVMVGYALAAIGTVFSLYLQYQSIFVIHATCKWCLTSAAIMIVTLILYAVLAQAVEKSPPVTGGDRLDRLGVYVLPVALVLGLVGMAAMMEDNSKGTGVPEGLPPNVKEILTAAGQSVGPANAPVTIVEFADLQCPSCQKSTPAVHSFAERYPNTLHLVFRHFPLEKHEWASVSAAMAEYAGEKGKFWDFTLGVMGLQREIKSVDELYSIAESVGLDVKDLQKRLSNKDDVAYKRVNTDAELADTLGVQYTPTFFLFVDGYKVETANSNSIMEILESPKVQNVLSKKQ